MVRRLAGARSGGENFVRAEIVIGRTDSDQGRSGGSIEFLRMDNRERNFEPFNYSDANQLQRFTLGKE